MKILIREAEFEVTAKCLSRFWAKVEKTDRCWTWKATKCRGGYGKFAIATQKFVQAHRFSWMVTYGDIKAGMDVLHACDNPSCVNPEHLWLGTDKDNQRDCVLKGRNGFSLTRFRPGALHPHSKLTWEEVHEIRKRYCPGMTTLRRTGEEFGVSRSVIGKIIRNQIWKE